MVKLDSESYLATYRHNLALTYLEKGNYSKALFLLNKTLVYHSKSSKKNNTYWLSLATIYGQIRRAYLGLNKIDSALVFNTEAYELRKKYLGTIYHPHLAASLDNRGDIFYAKKDYQQALNLYHQGLQSLVPTLSDNTLDNPNFTQQTATYPSHLITLLTSKAQSLQSLSAEQAEPLPYLKVALQTYQCLDTLVVLVRKGFKVASSGYRLVESVTPVYEQAIQLSLQLYEQTKEAQYLELAYDFCAKNKAIILLESWQNEKAKFAGIPARLRQEERDLKKKYRMVETDIYDLFNEKDTVELAEKKQELFDIKWEYDQLITTFEQDYPKYKNLKTVFSKPLSIADIQRKLSRKTALIEYFVGEETIFTFVLTKKGIQYYQSPKPAEFETVCQQLLGWVDSLSIYSLEASAMNRIEQQYLQGAYQVYQWILAAPLQALEQQDKIQRLRIIPDNYLLPLSFDFLLTEVVSTWQNQDNPYLLKKYALSIAYSNQLLFDQRGSKRLRKDLKKFGGFGLEYDSITLQALSAIDNFKGDSVWINRSVGRLEHSDDEVKEIAALFGSSKEVWINHEATKSIFWECAQEFNILHLAMHGIVIDEQPDFSSLVFTKTSDSSDFLLKAIDLYELELQADMVVLSACHTGYGTLNRGEGMRSLARAFTYAGSPSLVASLWGASDAATKEILVSYYQFLVEGLPKDIALQQAKLTYLQNNSATFTSPTYWSHLVAIGDVSPITEHSFVFPSWIFVLLMGLIGGGFYFWRHENYYR